MYSSFSPIFCLFFHSSYLHCCFQPFKDWNRLFSLLAYADGKLSQANRYLDPCTFNFSIHCSQSSNGRRSIGSSITQFHSASIIRCQSIIHACRIQSRAPKKPFGACLERSSIQPIVLRWYGATHSYRWLQSSLHNVYIFIIVSYRITHLVCTAVSSLMCECSSLHLAHPTSYTIRHYRLFMDIYEFVFSSNQHPDCKQRSIASYCITSYHLHPAHESITPEFSLFSFHPHGMTIYFCLFIHWIHHVNSVVLHFNALSTITARYTLVSTQANINKTTQTIQTTSNEWRAFFTLSCFKHCSHHRYYSSIQFCSSSFVGLSLAFALMFNQPCTNVAKTKTNINPQQMQCLNFHSIDHNHFKSKRQFCMNFSGWERIRLRQSHLRRTCLSRCCFMFSFFSSSNCARFLCAAM